ncbi:hypothetical protein B0H34DRAFT_794116 [Crassisporium funariophilum]|nr:hypothetical protein B0H34DRAFT_794116 [Crassisporium funariophilum]
MAVDSNAVYAMPPTSSGLSQIHHPHGTLAAQGWEIYGAGYTPAPGRDLFPPQAVAMCLQVHQQQPQIMVPSMLTPVPVYNVRYPDYPDMSLMTSTMTLDMQPAVVKAPRRRAPSKARASASAPKPTKKDFTRPGVPQMQEPQPVAGPSNEVEHVAAPSLPAAAQVQVNKKSTAKCASKKPKPAMTWQLHEGIQPAAQASFQVGSHSTQNAVANFLISFQSALPVPPVNIETVKICGQATLSGLPTAHHSMLPKLQPVAITQAPTLTPVVDHRQDGDKGRNRVSPQRKQATAQESLTSQAIGSGSKSASVARSTPASASQSQIQQKAKPQDYSENMHLDAESFLKEMMEGT